MPNIANISNNILTDSGVATSSLQPTITLTTTGTSGASTLISNTLNIPNYGSALTGYVPTSRQLTINGTAYDLSADRTWSVGTVTTVSFTLGGTGTDLNSSVVNSTTTPAITLNVPTASAANRGALSAADWSTFNTKVGGVTATTPLFSSGGSTPNLTIQQSSGSQAGYLSSTDWTTFNNKQAAGNYITSLTGEATATGPGAAAVTLDNASVTAKILTGVNITGGTVLATDTMLTAFGKLQNQVNGLIGGSIYQGTWNASTNTPTLTSSVGTQGYYYIVSVAGNTNLNGITDWFVGDWAIFNGGVWQQVDNTDAVVSVNGQTGAVSLTTDNISEGVTNLYFTNTRARAALSFVAGSGAYNSSTGAITIPTNTSQLTNGANFITLASLSGTAPISYNSGTGAISITQAATASNGYLSSTDWNTFNNKQATLSLTTTGTSGAATLVGATLNIPNYGSALTGYVPYTGATANVDLGGFNITAGGTSSFVAATLTSNLWLKNTGSSDFIISNNTSLTTNVVRAYYTTTDELRFYAKNTAGASVVPKIMVGDGTTFTQLQSTITLTTTGTSGAATFTSNTLNIPNYGSALSGYLPLTGGTLTGPLNGTSATFNGQLRSIASGAYSGGNEQIGAGIVSSAALATVQAVARFSNFGSGYVTKIILSDNSIADAVISYEPSGTATSSLLGFGSGTAKQLTIDGNGKVTLTGALSGTSATFSSSVTAQGYFALTTTSNAYATQGTLSWNDVRGTVISAKTASIFDFAVYGAAAQALIINPTGTSVIAFNSGNVGIGTSSPADLLHINGSGIIKMQIQGSTEAQLRLNSGYGQISNVSGDLYYTIESASGSQIFRTGSSTERMRITSTGNVGIGVNPTTTTFQVQGAVNNNLAFFNNTSNSGYASARFFNDTSKEAVFGVGGSGVGAPYANNGYIYTGASTDFVCVIGTTEKFRIQSNGSMYNSNAAANNWALEINGSSTASQSYGFKVKGGTNSSDYSFLAQDYSGGTSFLAIKGNGNVGIGTTSPSQKLEVAGVIRGEVVNAYGSTDPASTSPYLYSPSSGALGIGANGSERMRITSGGNVGIGLTNPTGQLSIKNQVYYGSAPASSYAATTGVEGQNFFNGYYAVDTDGLGPYPRYLDIVSIGSPDGSNGGSNIRFFTNPIAVSSPAVERMRVSSKGHLGIGTANPVARLSLNTNAVGLLCNFTDGIYQSFQVNTTSGGIDITNPNSGYISFSNTSEKMRITSGGALCLGVTSAYGTNLLNVNGGIYATSSIAAVVASNIDMFVFQNTGSTYTKSAIVASIGIVGDTSSYFFYGQHSTNTTAVAALKIFSNGNIQNFNNSYAGISDITLKKDIVKATSKLDDLMKVNIVNFKFINDITNTKQIGVIAQELEKIFPNMIDIDGNTKLKSVKYSVFVPMLIKAVQELKAEIETLKNK